MDWETSLLCLGLVVGSAFLLFIISTLGTRGQSYEEVVAANRRLVAQRGLLDDPVKQKRLQQQQSKKNKKAGKKVKEKQAKEQAATSNSESEAPAESGIEEEPSQHHKGHVEFVETPVVTPDDIPKPPKNRKKTKDAKVKPILINKDDSNYVSDASAPPSPTLTQSTNHFEQIHPKDEFELLHTTTNDKNKKKVKDVKVKPILINKDDPSCISDVSTPPSPVDTEPANHFEQIHPKDEFELLHSSSGDKEKVEATKPKEKKAGKPAKTAVKPEKVQEKEKPVKPSAEIPLTSEPPKEQRKSKNKPEVVEVNDVVEKSPEECFIMPSLSVNQPADMTTDKILKQTYPLESILSNANNVDSVIEVQQPKAIVPQQAQPPAPKSKKKKNELAQYQQLITCPEGVNVNLLVQLLGDAPLSRSEIQILTDCLLNKQNGPLPEHSEWSEGPKDPLIKLKKQLAEKEKAFTSEQEASQALQAKLKELRVTLNAERARCTQLNAAKEEVANVLKAEAAALQSRIQRGIDENNSLRQQVTQLQTKVTAEAEWASQRSQMELHIQTLSEKNAALGSSIMSLQNENGELQKAHSNATGELNIALGYKRQLEEVNNMYTDMEQKLKQQLAQANERLQVLTEAQSEVQRLTTVQSNFQQQTMQHEKRQEELDKQNQQIVIELGKLKTEKEDLVLLVAELKEQLAAQPTPNGTTSPDKNDIVDVEKAIADACSELEEKHSQQLDNLQRQLDQHRDKNNELRTKNWKVMEALQAVEKKLQQFESQKTTDDNKLSEAVTNACLEEQRSTKDVLERLFPDVSAQGRNHKEWLDNFTEKANAFLEASSTPQVIEVNPEELVDNARLKDLETNNHQLQCLVDNYKGIVVDTEKTLSRLQDYVTEEEQKWKVQLSDKQNELDNMKICLIQIKNETVSLQSALDCEKKLRQDIEINERDSLLTTKASKSPSGLGDVERLMEENTRLKELVEKLQNSSQTLNGPSQLQPIATFKRKATKKRRTLAGWIRRKITFRRKKNKEMRAVDQDREPIVREIDVQHNE